MNQKRKILLAVMVGVMCVVAKPTVTKAALQANGDTPATYTVDHWILNIRKMQEAGGTLGLTDTISETDLTSGNKNLDIHMEKNTEYGAMAILSASSYGNPEKIPDGGTTTGNASGIKINFNKEWVAAATAEFASDNFKKAAGRYKNIYTTTYEPKVGDAVGETSGWHGSLGKNWLRDGIDYGLLRTYSNSIFEYFGSLNIGTGNDYVAERNNQWSSRGVVIVGSGL